MKLLDLTYEEALRRHPQEVSSILEKFRKSKGKTVKAASVEDLKWFYECCFEGESFSFAEVMAGVGLAHKQTQDALTKEEFLADHVRRTHTALQARLPHWSGAETVPNPPETLNWALESWASRFQE